MSGELRVDGETQASGNILGGYTEKGGALANSVMIDGSSVRPAENEAGEELAPPPDRRRRLGGRGRVG